MMFDKHALRALMSATLLLGAVGCGDDGNGSEDPDGGDNGGTNGDNTGDEDGGGSGNNNGNNTGDEDSGAPEVDPRYAFITQIFGADPADNVSYVILSDNLDDDLSLDDQEVAVEGRAIGFGPDEGDVLFVGSDAGPTITRYDLSEDGTSLREGETVSFMGKGVTGIGEYPGQFYFVSDEKAYYFDGSNAQVVVWNPKDMVLIDDLPLNELVVDSTVLTFSSAPLTVGDSVVTFPGWRTMTGVPSEAAVVMVDTSSDDATVVKDDRCGYVRDGILHDDGYIYMATDNYASSVYRLNEDNAPAPCMIRFDPETQKFDEDFLVELNSLFDGDTAGMLLRGPDNAAYLAVLDEDATDVTEDTHPRVLASAGGAWPWARVTLGDEPSAERLSVDPGNGSIVVQRLGERIFIPQYVGRDSTDMREVTNKGPDTVRMNVPGLVFSAAKLRR